MILFILVGLVAGFWWKNRLVAPKLQASSITNSFLIGTVTQVKEDKQRLEQQMEKLQQDDDNKIERVRADYNNQITQLKIDANELMK